MDAIPIIGEAGLISKGGTKPSLVEESQGQDTRKINDENQIKGWRSGSKSESLEFRGRERRQSRRRWGGHKQALPILGACLKFWQEFGLPFKPGSVFT